MGHGVLIFAGTWEFGVNEEFWGGERLSCVGFCALCENGPEEDRELKEKPLDQEITTITYTAEGCFGSSAGFGSGVSRLGTFARVLSVF